MTLTRIKSIKSRKKWNRHLQNYSRISQMYRILGLINNKQALAMKDLLSPDHTPCQHQQAPWTSSLNSSARWTIHSWIIWLIWWNLIHQWWKNNMNAIVEQNSLINSTNKWCKWWILIWSRWLQTWWSKTRVCWKKQRTCMLKEPQSHRCQIQRFQLTHQHRIHRLLLRSSNSKSKGNNSRQQELEQSTILSLKK